MVFASWKLKRNVHLSRFLDKTIRSAFNLELLTHTWQNRISLKENSIYIAEMASRNAYETLNNTTTEPI